MVYSFDNRYLICFSRLYNLGDIEKLLISFCSEDEELAAIAILGDSVNWYVRSKLFSLIRTVFSKWISRFRLSERWN